MRPAAVVAGIILVAFGAFATFGGDIAASWWWLIATSCAAAGVIGMAAALRSEPEPISPD